MEVQGGSAWTPPMTLCVLCSHSAHPAVPVPLPQHLEQDPALRVPAPHKPGRDWCPGQGRKAPKAAASCGRVREECKHKTPCSSCVAQVDDTDVINFLLSTEIIPLCLRTMEIGSELSKTVATFIVQKILLDDVSGDRESMHSTQCTTRDATPHLHAHKHGRSSNHMHTSHRCGFPSAGGVELHLRNRRALLCSGGGAGQHGGGTGRGARLQCNADATVKLQLPFQYA